MARNRRSDRGRTGGAFTRIVETQLDRITQPGAEAARGKLRVRSLRTDVTSVTLGAVAAPQPGGGGGGGGGGSGGSEDRIPLRFMNLDPNNITGTALRGYACVPLKASRNVTPAAVANVSVWRNNAEVQAFVGALDSTNPEWGGGTIAHHMALRDAVTGRYAQVESDRPLLAIIVEVDLSGLAFGATRDFEVRLHTPPTQARLVAQGWQWSNNAPHIRINQADTKRLEVHPFYFWKTRWGKRTAGFQGLEPFVDTAPTLVSGVLPLPEGGSRTPDGVPALDGTIVAGAPLVEPTFALSLAANGDSTLAAGTTYYVGVAAVDKNGDVTTVTAQTIVGVAGQEIVVTIQPHPNAITYNTYIGTSAGTMKSAGAVSASATLVRTKSIAAPSASTVVPPSVNNTGREMAVYRLMWYHAANRVAFARTPGHVDNSASGEYWQNDLQWIASIKLIIAANNTFTWGTTPLTHAMVTLEQGNPLIGVPEAAVYGAAPGTARVTDANRFAWMDNSIDANILYYDSAPQAPKTMGWVPDATYLCATDMIVGILPKSVTDTWGQDYIDTDYTLRRWVVGNWGWQGRFVTAFANAHYNPQRGLIAEHLRTADPFWLLVAISGFPAYDRFWGVRSNYTVGQDRNACVGLKHLYLMTGCIDFARFVIRTAGENAWRFGRSTLTSSGSTRYYIKAGATCLAAARLRAWRTGDYAGGVVNDFTNGYDAFNRIYGLVAQGFGKDGPDGSATAHHHFLSDFGEQAHTGLRDATNRNVAVYHKVIFAEGLVGEALVEFLDYDGGTCPSNIAAGLVTAAKAGLQGLGEHAIEMQTWRGARPWLGDIIQPARNNVQDGFCYVSDENGGQRYINLLGMTALGLAVVTPPGVAYQYSGAAWITGGGAPTHGRLENNTDTPYAVGSSPLSRPQAIFNGLFHPLIGWCAAKLPSHAYGTSNNKAWLFIQEMMLRKTTMWWVPPDFVPNYNGGVGYFDINNPGDGPYYKLNKSFGESFCNYGYRMRDYAVAKGLPVA